VSWCPSTSPSTDMEPSFSRSRCWLTTQAPVGGAPRLPSSGFVRPTVAKPLYSILPTRYPDMFGSSPPPPIPGIQIRSLSRCSVTYRTAPYWIGEYVPRLFSSASTQSPNLRPSISLPTDVVPALQHSCIRLPRLDDWKKTSLACAR
jgi:hypothetical protein